MTLYQQIEALAATDPNRLARLMQSLTLSNPEARRFIEMMLNDAKGEAA